MSTTDTTQRDNFLKKELAYERYLLNIRKRDVNHYEEDILDEVFLKCIKYPISASFNWSDTDEGHNYWSNLNNRHEYGN